MYVFVSPSFGSSSHTQVWTLALLRLQCTLQMPYFCEQHALRDYSNIAQSNLTGTASECCCQQGTAALNLSTQSKTHSAVIMISLPYKSKSKCGRHQTLAKTSELASLLHCCAYARCRTEKRGLLTEPSCHCQRKSLVRKQASASASPDDALQYRTMVTVRRTKRPLGSRVRGVRWCPYSTSIFSRRCPPSRSTLPK